MNPRVGREEGQKNPRSGERTRKKPAGEEGRGKPAQGEASENPREPSGGK